MIGNDDDDVGVTSVLLKERHIGYMKQILTNLIGPFFD